MVIAGVNDSMIVEGLEKGEEDCSLPDVIKKQEFHYHSRHTGKSDEFGLVVMKLVGRSYSTRQMTHAYIEVRDLLEKRSKKRSF